MEVKSADKCVTWPTPARDSMHCRRLSTIRRLLSLHHYPHACAPVRKEGYSLAFVWEIGRFGRLVLIEMAVEHIEAKEAHFYTHYHAILVKAGLKVIRVHYRPITTRG